MLEQYLNYSVENSGEIYTPEFGIPRGCALSPLTGAILLWHMDHYFSTQQKLFYVRYMDDFLILTKTRWPLKRAIRDLNRYFNLDGFERHPDKTQVGRIEKGFDWCGVQFGDHPPRISDRSLQKHRAKCLRLEEQLRAKGMSEADIRARVQAYRVRWENWACSINSTNTER